MRYMRENHEMKDKRALLPHVESVRSYGDKTSEISGLIITFDPRTMWRFFLLLSICSVKPGCDRKSLNSSALD